MTQKFEQKIEAVWNQKRFFHLCVANHTSRRTDDVDFDLSRDGCDVVFQLQGVGAFVRADAWRDDQLCEHRLGRQGDTFIGGGQLLLSEGPLGDGGRVSGDGDSDGERLRDDHLQAVPEGAQVEGRTHCQERKMVQRGV